MPGQPPGLLSSLCWPYSLRVRLREHFPVIQVLPPENAIDSREADEGWKVHIFSRHSIFEEQVARGNGNPFAPCQSERGLACIV